MGQQQNLTGAVLGCSVAPLSPLYCLFAVLLSFLYSCDLQGACESTVGRHISESNIIKGRMLRVSLIFLFFPLWNTHSFCPGCCLSSAAVNANCLTESFSLQAAWKYELFAVVAHSGTTSYGHYCAYIRSLTECKWYCFNDSFVEQVRREIHISFVAFQTLL